MCILSGLNKVESLSILLKEPSTGAVLHWISSFVVGVWSHWLIGHPSHLHRHLHWKLLQEGVMKDPAPSAHRLLVPFTSQEWLWLNPNVWTSTLADSQTWKAHTPKCLGLSQSTIHEIFNGALCRLSADFQRVCWQCRLYQTSLTELPTIYRNTDETL